MKRKVFFSILLLVVIFVVFGMYFPPTQEDVVWDRSTTNRLEISSAQELGIDSRRLRAIDKIVQEAIEQEAFPGCQIVAAVDGKIFFQKSYGTHSYDNRLVKDDDLYDLASITKIASSTLALMYLQTQGKFSLDKTLADYIPDLTENTYVAKLTLREILAHQAGFKAWIPFYKHTLIDGKPNPTLYRMSDSVNKYNQVAERLFIKKEYYDSMLNEISHRQLGTKKYLYSDLGYYFIKEIIERQSGKKLEYLLAEDIYSKMGLSNILYKPLRSVDRMRIVPTEIDNVFRQQLIHGYVHDPGAAMIGGVGGHAGLFSNATDLAAIMQLFLNKGAYDGVQLIDEKVVEEYTHVQFQGNRRGAGFDKPVLKTGGGACHESASMLSFGHSGFTGTLAWADPKNKLVYVFLSNRVYPSAENKKLITMGVRTQIQKVFNDALTTRKRVF